jgi:hypothetical protein
MFHEFCCMALYLSPLPKALYIYDVDHKDTKFARLIGLSFSKLTRNPSLE